MSAENGPGDSNDGGRHSNRPRSRSPRRRDGDRRRGRSPDGNRSRSRSPGRRRGRGRSYSPRRRRSRSWSRSRSRSPRNRRRDHRVFDRIPDRMMRGPPGPPFGGGYGLPPHPDDEWHGPRGYRDGPRPGPRDSFGPPPHMPPYDQFHDGPPGGPFGGPHGPFDGPSMRGGGRRRRDEGPPGVSLLVRNLSPDIATHDLQMAFGRIGVIRDVYIPRDYHSQTPKGFAFVEYASPEMAREAKAEMNNFVIKGRPLEVVFAQERRKTPNEMRGRDPHVRSDSRRGFERSSSFERHKQREREQRRDGDPPNDMRGGLGPNEGARPD